MTDTTPTPPVYEGISITRHLGRGITVDTAPEHTRMGLGILLGSVTVHIREVSPGRLLIADQVEYEVTGYDPETRDLTLRLVNDFRPSATAADTAPPLPHREPGAAWAAVEAQRPDGTDTARTTPDNPTTSADTADNGPHGDGDQ